LPISSKQILWTFLIGLGLQFWSWLGWGFAVIFLLENKVYQEVRYSQFPKWMILRADSLLGRINAMISGVLFSVISVHVNLLFTNPNNMLRDTSLPYLGVAINLLCFTLVMNQVMDSRSVLAPTHFGVLSFLRYTIRRNTRNRIFHCCPVRSPIDSVVWRGRVSRFGSRLLEVPVKWAFSRTV
jgi:hypothetical protein